jgi:hypothetical protein
VHTIIEIGLMKCTTAQCAIAALSPYASPVIWYHQILVTMMRGHVNLSRDRPGAADDPLDRVLDAPLSIASLCTRIVLIMLGGRLRGVAH